MKTPENLHIGKLIHEQLHKNGQSVVWLRKELNWCHAKMYRILNNSYIYSDDLLQISSVMQHDFFLDISNYLSDTKPDTKKV